MSKNENPVDDSKENISQELMKDQTPVDENTNFVDIQYAVFLVNENPYCFWDIDIPLKNSEFIENIDPSYFEYLANTFLNEDSPETNLLASLALRTTYSQALETLFALIGCIVQAPYCAPAWLTTYWPKDIKEIVEKISSNNSVPNILLNKERLSWQLVSEFIHSWLKLDDNDKEARIISNYAKLWGNFASDFLNSGFNDEYNSIKHGFRIKPGGFHIAIGLENEPGKPAPPENMRILGKSEYGSSFFVKENIKKHHFQIKRYHRNWDPEDFAWGLQLISMSIQNIVSALKIINGKSAEDVKFVWPSEDDTLKEPWKRVKKIGIHSITGFQNPIPTEMIKLFTKEEIASMYKAGNQLVQRIRYIIPRESNESNDA